MGPLGGRGCSPALIHSSPSPQCLLAMDVRFLPGISSCLGASYLLQPSTNCSFHPQTHTLCIFPVSMQQLSLGIRSQVEGPCFSPPQGMGWAGTLHRSGHWPFCSGDKEGSIYPGILCAPAVRGAC